MSDVIDANTLADPVQVRRTILAADHQAALRAGDDKEVARLAKEIQAEYAEEAKS